MKGARELAFFGGKAVGPVYPGFCYESEAGAHAAAIAFQPLSGENRSSTESSTAACSVGHSEEATGFAPGAYILALLLKSDH